MSTESLVRGLGLSELVKFAAQELEQLQLVLANPPAALTELVARGGDIAHKIDGINELLDDGFDSVAELARHIDEVHILVSDHNRDTVAEVAKDLAELRDLLLLHDFENFDDLANELTRLHNFASAIGAACATAGIEVTF